MSTKLRTLKKVRASLLSPQAPGERSKSAAAAAVDSRTLLTQSSSGRRDRRITTALAAAAEARASVDAIIEYARILGLDPVTEQAFLFLAEDVLHAALPTGCKRLEDKDSGRIYFYDQNTQETTWEPPLHEVGRRAVAHLRLALADRSFSRVDKDLDETEKGIQKELDNWLQVYDADAKPYFLHTQTKGASYDDPRNRMFSALFMQVKLVQKMKAKLPTLVNAPPPPDPSVANGAATRIQSYWRMVMGKKERRRRHSMQRKGSLRADRISRDGTVHLSVVDGDVVLSLTDDCRRQKAATRIQARFRGHKARSQHRNIVTDRTRRDSATKIQAMMRSRFARRSVEAIRQERGESKEQDVARKARERRQIVGMIQNAVKTIAGRKLLDAIAAQQGLDADARIRGPTLPIFRRTMPPSLLKANAELHKQLGAALQKNFDLSATLIQSGYRGHIQRVAVAQLRHERELLKYQNLSAERVRRLKERQLEPLDVSISVEPNGLELHLSPNPQFNQAAYLETFASREFMPQVVQAMQDQVLSLSSRHVQNRLPSKEETKEELAGEAVTNGEQRLAAPAARRADAPVYASVREADGSAAQELVTSGLAKTVVEGLVSAGLQNLTTQRQHSPTQPPTVEMLKGETADLPAGDEQPPSAGPAPARQEPVKMRKTITLDYELDNESALQRMEPSQVVHEERPAAEKPFDIVACESLESQATANDDDREGIVIEPPETQDDKPDAHVSRSIDEPRAATSYAEWALSDARRVFTASTRSQPVRASEERPTVKLAPNRKSYAGKLKDGRFTRNPDIDSLTDAQRDQLMKDLEARRRKAKEEVAKMRERSQAKQREAEEKKRKREEAMKSEAAKEAEEIAHQRDAAFKQWLSDKRKVAKEEKKKQSAEMEDYSKKLLLKQERDAEAAKRLREERMRRLEIAEQKRKQWELAVAQAAHQFDVPPRARDTMFRRSFQGPVRRNVFIEHHYTTFVSDDDEDNEEEEAQQGGNGESTYVPADPDIPIRNASSAQPGYASLSGLVPLGKPGGASFARSCAVYGSCK
ncbi:unnamed protein product [Vitrella brassicaformis CCMP3155]|uniref:WW domain-containing protein n=1 Tax=Vitrella brassicaformis (strain CCMP3155) TaxID=1169540 RepID=A0A0G4EI64_VITBC|nr:unnamed protein product [Vitrella brassicaformis CCMP3155]|eukprot:CEL95671.1 unnamed protein product [Vitrella brassicaformis CCMP3155]